MFTAADKLVADGKFDEAVEHYETVKTKWPDSPEAVRADDAIYEAMASKIAEQSGRGDAAARLSFEVLLARFPDKAKVDKDFSAGASFALASASASLPHAPEQALASARSVYSDWKSAPDADSERAFLEALKPVLSARLKVGEILETASLLKQMDEDPSPAAFKAAAEAVVRGQGDDKRLAVAVLWLGGAANDERRAHQALALLALEPDFQPLIQDWLNANLFSGAADVCTTPLANVAAIEQMADLEAVQRNCELQIKYAPGAPNVAEVQAALIGPLDVRRKAIMASPVYRIEQALATCVEFQGWISEQRRHPPRTESQMERLQDEMERRQPGMQRAIEYLVDRAQSTGDRALARRIGAACAN